MKKTVQATIICCALVLGVVGVSSAAEVKSGNDKASVSVYGQVDRVMLHVDDGHDSDTFSADNDHSSTRLGFKAKAKKNQLTTGAVIEVEIESDSTSKLTMNGGTSQSSGISFAERHLNVFLEHAKLGKITLGQGSTASDGTSEVDLSGTAVAGYSDVEVMGGSFLFYDKATAAYSSVKVGDVFNNFDGLSRKDMLRYDSPSFGGVSFAASTSSYDGGDAKDIAVRYSGKLGGTKLAAAASYVDYQTSDLSKDNQYSGSVSVLLPFGLNFTAAYGNLSHDAASRNDASMIYGKIGYIAEIFEVGTTAVAVDYAVHDDVKANDDKAKVLGLQVVQTLSDWSTELFVGVRNYSMDRTGTNYEDVMAAMTGARIKF